MFIVPVKEKKRLPGQLFYDGVMETDRIILRPWRDSDAPALYKWAADPDVGPRAGWPPHRSIEESLEVIRTVFHDATNSWAIELKEKGEVIGAMGYGSSCYQVPYFRTLHRQPCQRTRLGEMRFRPHRRNRNRRNPVSRCGSAHKSASPGTSSYSLFR